MVRRETGKAAEWRERRRRFGASGMTVTRFCELEGVSAPSFYVWRRKLTAGMARPATATPTAAAAPAATTAAANTARPVFQQVVVTPGAAALAGVRVRLASGAEIEVAAGNLDAIRAVVGELARVECAFAAGEHGAC